MLPNKPALSKTDAWKGWDNSWSFIYSKANFTKFSLKRTSWPLFGTPMINAFKSIRLQLTLSQCNSTTNTKQMKLHLRSKWDLYLYLLLDRGTILEDDYYQPIFLSVSLFLVVIVVKAAGIANKTRRAFMLSEFIIHALERNVIPSCFELELQRWNLTLRILLTQFLAV